MASISQPWATERLDEWSAAWIEPIEASDGPTAHRPAYHLATEFDVGGPVVAATLFATAHGVYEAFINGERVGDIELTPGFTAYRSRVQVHAFDVIHLVVEGVNAMGALLSDGWWRGQHGVIREIDAYAEAQGFTRSGFLLKAARGVLAGA